MATEKQNSPEKTNTVGLVGFIFSLVSIVLFWIPFFGIALAAAGIVLSAVGMGKQKNNRGLAIAGLVVGIAAFVLSAFIIIAMLLFLSGGVTNAIHIMNATVNYSNGSFGGY